jgi:hypothetical protein
MKFITLKESRKPAYIAPNFSVKSIKKSLPFLESYRGLYAHRVRFVNLHTNPKGSHFSIKVWCGATFCNGGKGKGETYFVEEPSKNKPICATCEGRFIGSGNAGERIINGRPVMHREY